MKVYLVNDGDYFEVVLDSHVKVGNGLCLNALCGVHNEQSTLTGGNGAGHFVGEIHMSRRINQIQRIGFAVFHVIHLYGMALDGNAALALQIHIVQHLRLHVFGINGFGGFKQAVCQGTFAVIYMSDDTEITDILHQLRLFFKRANVYVFCGIRLPSPLITLM
ncbi:hypothetical protein Barb7_03162 [Bacteroidales bacterium Barb7]|nr:hypothetical protein Barb7_03162 [Bacteroidales bacterium Barb7]